MTPEHENVKTLARLTGISEEDAAQRLRFRVRVSAANGVSVLFAGYLARIVGLTVDVVGDGQTCDLAVAVNSVPEADAPLSLTVTLTTGGMTIHKNPRPQFPSDDVSVPDLALKIAACYAAGVIIAHAAQDGRAARLPDPFYVRFANLGVDPDLLGSAVTLEDTVLIGAGGVANGFVWAAESLDLRGDLTVVDPKPVSDGNLNRCLYFRADDVGKDKATQLCAIANLPQLRMIPYVGTFQTLRRERQRVRRVIVTVDSRAARRSIQNELPLEVIDASTTDISAIVVHSHVQPTDGACLSCIYHHIPRENERLRDIASGLGISEEEAGQDFIDAAVAAKLAANHPSLDGRALEGVALTSLYKELCGAQSLKSSAGEQALAPFAFVSVLAGCMLALEMIRMDAGIRQSENTNYMQLDPWSPPHGRARRWRGRNSDCAFCSDADKVDVLAELWPDKLPMNIPGVLSTEVNNG